MKHIRRMYNVLWDNHDGSLPMIIYASAVVKYSDNAYTQEVCLAINAASSTHQFYNLPKQN